MRQFDRTHLLGFLAVGADKLSIEAFPFDIVIGVLDGQDANDIVVKRSSLLRLSPEEPIHAALIRISELISSGADDESLTKWRVMLLNSRLDFRCLNNEEAARWMSIALREDLGHKHKFMYRTALQRIFEVVTVAESLGGEPA